jgi:Mn-containing catalase
MRRRSTVIQPVQKECDAMFMHQKRLQYHAVPSAPDPLFAKKLQEVLGGQWGEISVMMTYLFQGWNCRGPAKYRDMLLDVATEEIGHCEMLATMIARLLETAPVEAQEDAARNPLVAAIMGGTNPETVLAGMNPQHLIVTGQGAAPTDSVGFPWTSRYTIASGNLLADFRFNVTAESQGRLQVARLYSLTEDTGVRDLLSFLLARDTMHQNQWLAAIEELEGEGLDHTPVPASVPRSQELGSVAYQYMKFSADGASREGRWATGPAPDGTGEIEFVAVPEAMGDEPELGAGNPRLYGTSKIQAPVESHR